MSNKDINFPVITTSLGRNGNMKTTGLNILNQNNVVTLTPINTKGLGRCTIEVPNDEKTLNELIQSLQSIPMERAGIEQIPFSQLAISDQFNWPLASGEKRKMVKICGEFATPKINADDIFGFRGECPVTPWIGD